MFLMQLPEGQAVRWVFFTSDPRKEGCPKPIVEGVEYEDGTASEMAPAFAKPAPSETVFGRSKDEPHRFKTFNNREELAAAGYEQLSGRAALYSTWRAYESSVVSISDGKRHGHTSHG